MSKTWDERRWEWLRVRKRIELVTFLFSVFSFLVFAIPAILYTRSEATDTLDAALLLGILLTGCAGFSLTICLPMYLILRSRRTKWRKTLSEAEPGIASEASARPIPLGRVYALMAAVTLASAVFQTTHLEIFGRIFGPSVVSVFLWNFGILGVALAIHALVRRGNNSK
jgi:uncharacterized membrane protein